MFARVWLAVAWINLTLAQFMTGGNRWLSSVKIGCVSFILLWDHKAQKHEATMITVRMMATSYVDGWELPGILGLVKDGYRNDKSRYSLSRVDPPDPAVEVGRRSGLICLLVRDVQILAKTTQSLIKALTLQLKA